MILIRQHSGHVTTAHLLIDQQALGAAVAHEGLDEELLHVRLPDLLQRQLDLLRLDLVRLYKDRNDVTVTFR